MFKPLEERSSGNFLSIQGGESVLGFFYGEPVTFYEHFRKGKCTRFQPEGCEHCNAGDKASFKFQVGFATKVDGVFVLKDLKQGKRLYNLLVALSQDYDLANWQVRITRQGTKKDDTTYTVNALPKGELTKEMVAFRDSLSKEKSSEEPGDFNEDIPF